MTERKGDSKGADDRPLSKRARTMVLPEVVADAVIEKQRKLYDQIPNEIMRRLFAYLSVKDLAAAASTSRRTTAVEKKVAAPSDIRSLELDLRERHAMTDDDIVHMIEWMERNPDRVGRLLTPMSILHRFWHHTQRISQAQRSVERLTGPLSVCLPLAEAWSHSLKSLDLNLALTSGDVVDALLRLPFARLQQLRISDRPFRNLHALRTADGHYDAALRNLLELEIEIRVTDHLPFVAKTPKLQSLVLYCGAMPTESATLGALLGSLAHLKNTLTSIFILNWGKDDARDPEAVIQALAALPMLERLSMEGTGFQFEPASLRQLFVEHKELTHLAMNIYDEDSFLAWMIASQGLVPRLVQIKDDSLPDHVHCDVAVVATWLHEHPLFSTSEYDYLIMTVRNDAKDAKALGAVLDRWSPPSMNARMSFIEVKSDTTEAFVDGVVQALERNVGKFDSRAVGLFFLQGASFSARLLHRIPIGIADVTWTIIDDGRTLTTDLLSRFVASNRCSVEYRPNGDNMVRGVAPSFLAGQSSCATRLDLHRVMFADWTETDVEKAMDYVSKLPARFTITFRVPKEVGQSPRLRHVIRRPDDGEVQPPEKVIVQLTR